jgi:hypothetical protein
MANVVTTENLGSEFDLGELTPNKLGVKNASQTQRGLLSTGDQRIGGVKRFAERIMAGGVGLPHSRLQSAGSLATGMALVSTSLTLTDAHHVVIVTGPANITIPGAATCPGRQYIIKNVSGATISVSATAGSQFRRSDTITTTVFTLSSAVSPANHVWMVSTGTEWIYSMGG